MKQPTTQTLYDLFNDRIQFVIPAYQRAYVWNAEDNWDALWGDIAETADRYLNDSKTASEYKHFLGPIVLHQRHAEAGGIDPRLVIDGQQRLTTLQVLLAAAAHVVAGHGIDDVAEEINALTKNSGRKAEGDLRFKVLPSRKDRKAFAQLIDKRELGDVTGGLADAFVYFVERIDDWLTDDSGDLPSDVRVRSEALQTCLDSLLYVVSINLDDSDNAQVIFETLNARGTGLGALDLVKNAVFLKADQEAASAELLHSEHWEPTFESDDYWMEEVRQGRQTRARADWFLMHWLAMELGEVVRVDKLFDSFRKQVLHASHAMPVQALVPRFCEDARIMRSFDDFATGSREQLFFSRLDALDTTTLLPIALFLFRSKELDEGRRTTALDALESWLVRRAIVKLTPKNYNRTLTSLLKAIKDEPADADRAVVRELRSSQAVTAIWPEDDVIRERLERNDVYGYLTPQARVRLLLEAVELDVRDPDRTEDISIPAGLSIEHALPQTWSEHWPVEEGEDKEARELERSAHVHRLGNLTLITKSLNSALRNAAWNPESGYSKRDELASRSVLLINQHLCQNEQWNEELIDARSRDFAERILRTWPGPNADRWPEVNVNDLASSS